MQTLNEWLTEQEEDIAQYDPDESMGIEREPLRIALKIIRAITEEAGKTHRVVGQFPQIDPCVIAEKIINEVKHD